MRKMRAESAPLAMPTRSVPDNLIADVTRESHYNAWIQRYLKPH
jgi:hypothetical protein